MKATSLNDLIKMTETYFVFLLYRKKREGLKLFNAVISEMLNAVDSIAAKNPGINSLSVASPQLRNAAISNLGTSKSVTLTPVLRLYPQLTASLDDKVKSCTRGSSNLDVVWEEKSQMALSPF